MNSGTAIIKTRVRRSEGLSPEEWREYKKKVDSFEIKLDAMEFFGFKTVNTLDNIYLKGTGHPSSIATIREKLNLQTA
jgi:hypothetical protein